MQKALAVAAFSVPLLLWCTYCSYKKTKKTSTTPSKGLGLALAPTSRVFTRNQLTTKQPIDEAKQTTTVIVENGSRRVHGTILGKTGKGQSAMIPFDENPTASVEPSDNIKFRLKCILLCLKVDPAQCNVLATYKTRFNRDQFARLAFDCFKIPKLCLISEPQLALRSSGRTTGIVVDIGPCRTVVTPIYNELVCERMVKSISLGTKHIFQDASNMLKRHRCCVYESIDSISQRYAAECLLETFGYIHPRPNTVRQRRRLYPVEMYGRCYQVVPFPLESELHEPLELLFTNKTRTIQDCLRDAIDHGQPEIRDVMRHNIVVTGEFIRTIPGFKERLEFELHRAQPHSQFNVTISSPITGGKVQCSTMHPQQWITKEEYDLKGPRALDFK